MNKLKDYLHIIIVIIGLLIIIPVMYYFLYALPSYNNAKLEFEREKYEEEQQKIIDEENKKNQQASLLNSCLLDADLSYYSAWETECSAWKVQVDNAWRDCRADIYYWETDESNRSKCVTSTPDYDVDENGSCLLPKTRSADVEQGVKDKKDACYRQYSLN